MRTNPFSTRFFQPGAIAYECFGKSSVAELVQRLLKLTSKRGIIVGPHGSGKSTLVSSLVRDLSTIAPTTKIYQLRFSTGQSASIALNHAIPLWTKDSIAILDGYEQLGIWSRLRVERVARTRSVRLLVTAHQPVRGFEPIWETSVDDFSSEWVVEQLLAPFENPDKRKLLQSEAWKASRSKNGQNLRESLFDMYDWWQSHQS